VNIIILFLLIFCFCSDIQSNNVDSLSLNSDSLKTDFILIQIDTDRIDSSNLCNSDSLVLGRFTKNTTPWFIDLQFYLPFEDTLEIRIYDKEGSPITNLFKGYFSKGYYSLIVNPGIPSGVYFLLINSSKNSIFKKLVLIK